MIIWNLLVSACLTSVRFSVYSKITSIGGYNSVFLVFAGWLADVYFERYRVMKVSIWVMWWGSVCTDVVGGRHIPSRIDLGKSNCGGPFTTEQVEDVKTFFGFL